MLIEVYADVVCPWCYIGERRLRDALARRPEIEAERRWRPFQLRPEMPPAGLPWDAFAREKFGGEERARTAFDHVTRVGEPLGIRFDFGRVASAPNTVDAHRLILFAAEHDRQWETADALFRAYFADGKNLNDRDDLAEISAGAGLDADAARSYLEGEGGVRRVWESQEEARRRGVSSVPFYVIDDRYAVPGGQPAETWVEVLDAVRAERVT